MKSLGTNSFSKATTVYKHELWGKSYPSILPSNFFAPFFDIGTNRSESLPKGIFVDSFDDQGFEDNMHIDVSFMLVNEGRKLRIWIIDEAYLEFTNGYQNHNSIKAQLLLKLCNPNDLNFCRYTSQKSIYEHLAYSFRVDHGPIALLIRDALHLNSYVNSMLKMHEQCQNSLNRLGIKIKPNMPTPSNVSDLVIPSIDNSSYIIIKDGIKVAQIFDNTNP